MIPDGAHDFDNIEQIDLIRDDRRRTTFSSSKTLFRRGRAFTWSGRADQWETNGEAHPE